MSTHEQDKEMIRQCYEYTNKHSDDPDTKSGCVVQKRGPFGDYMYYYGANRIPEGMPIEPFMLERPAKYNYIEHCERDVFSQVLRSGFSLSGSTMYINWFPCVDCGRMIIGSGIKRLVLHKEGQETYERLASVNKGGDWHSIDTVDMIRKAGIQVDIVSATYDGKVKARFRGQDVFL